MESRMTARVSAVQWGALGLGLAAVFVVPYGFRPAGVISDAYMAGFSTRVALLLLLGVTMGFAWWTRGAGLGFRSGMKWAGEVSRRTLYWTGAITLAGAGVVWIGMHYAGPLNEANYFADRMLMQQSGATVYRDFEYPYGPILFYYPAVIHALVRLPWGDSYLLGFFLQWAVGSWMLWKMVRLATVGTGAGRAIYLLLWFFFLAFLMDGGAQYTPVRYCGTLLLALWVQRLVVRGGSMLPAFGVAAVGLVGLLCYSPEQAIGFGMASLVFLGMQGRRREGFAAGMVLFVGTMAGAMVVANRLGWLNDVKAFGNGGLAFPLALSLQNVMVMLLLVAAACAVVSCLRARDWSHPLLYFCLLSGASAPAAFGRSDPGHLILNLLGALIAGFVALRSERRLWYVATRAFVAFTICWFALGAYANRNVFGKALNAKVASRTPAGRLPVGRVILMPFGDSHTAFDFAEGNEAVGGRYAGLLPLMSRAEVQEKIAELAAHPEVELVIPVGSSLPCGYDLVAERRLMRQVLLPLYTPKLKRASTAAEPYCQFIAEHYRPAESGLRWQGMQLWEPVNAK